MNIVDLIIIASLLAFAGFGAWKGFILEIGQILALSGGIICANRFYRITAMMLEESIASEQIRTVAAYLIVFLGVAIIIAFIAKALHRFFQYIEMNWLNRVLGFLLGACKGFLLVALCIFVIDLLPQVEELRARIHADSQMYRVTKSLNDWLMTSIDMSDTYKDAESKAKDMFQGGDALQKQVDLLKKVDEKKK